MTTQQLIGYQNLYRCLNPDGSLREPPKYYAGTYIGSREDCERAKGAANYVATLPVWVPVESEESCG